MGDYAEFLAQKRRAHIATGLDEIPELSSHLFDWQKAVVAWALRKGRACLFEECGLGKTIQQLEWAAHVPGDVLIVTPLAVAHQTQQEAERFGMAGRVSFDGSLAGKVTITNYERLSKFDLAGLGGIVLDESSIIKSHDGATRNDIMERAASIPFRLACTATPAPNDHMELGNHAEFVGAMSRVEMLATFFTHDGGDTAKWRLKGHARGDFWKWVASWAMMLRSPADIGFPDNGYRLPELRMHRHVVKTEIKPEGELFVVQAAGLAEQRQARRATMDARVAACAEIANSPGQWLVWCELNDEGDALEAEIDGAVQVAGRHDDDTKAERMRGFTDGSVRVLVSKPSIAGFGMNWQHAHQMAFVGLSNSWEQYYQAIRREYRFGQNNPVDVHVVATDVEMAVLDNIERKQGQADVMMAEMVQYMRETMINELGATARREDVYTTKAVKGERWTANLGDCVEGVAGLPDNSVDYTIYSPPFSSLYTYSASDRDMGNASGDDEFMAHYRFLVAELYRVTKPGRLVSFHCMDLPSSKERHGYIGLRDFRGELIRAHQDAGWILHSQVVIWKDPVTAMQRTKALGLLWKQLKKDSTRSRMGIPDYLVTMVKPGENMEPVEHTAEEFPVEKWQRYASPVWDDINPSDTLQYRSAREDDDERHICPLQLGVIRRGIELWSNPGDLVLSPFMGIASEGYVAIEMDRRFVGFELKQSYFEQACRNLAAAGKQLSLF